MNLLDYMQNNILYLDGGMGTLLQASGLQPGEEPVMWNISHSDVVKRIHMDYFEAGSNVVNTNTFGADIYHFSEDELKKIIPAAVKNARDAANEAVNGYAKDSEKYVALDISSLGQLLKPYGQLDFEDAVEAFKITMKIGIEAGVDLIFIETMNDSYETKAAVLAAKEVSDLPIFVSNAYGEDGKLMTGASPAAMVAMLEGMGVTALGCNCSLGPAQLAGVVEELLANASTPIIFEPNAGLPSVVNGKTVFDLSADDFAKEVARQVSEGVRIVGGCCGTTPEFIRTLRDTLESNNQRPVPITEKGISCVSSYTHTVVFDKQPILIGERLNPTGKKRFKQALRENDITYILGQGLDQVEMGAHVLDVNVGTPEIDEQEMLERVVCELQAVTDTPLQIDTSDPIAMERALRRYNGKAMVNSVNGKVEVMEAVFPLVKKYGGFVVCLTLDEGGIPETADARVAIAEKIMKKAAEYGIAKKDLIFDTLAMTISADTKAALETLNSLDRIKHDLGAHTSLGVSNISFGLPERDMVNGTFFALALTRGLSAAIMNPHSTEMMKTYYAYRALNDMDESCMEYIDFAGKTAAKREEDLASAIKAGMAAAGVDGAGASGAIAGTAGGVGAGTSGAISGTAGGVGAGTSGAISGTAGGVGAGLNGAASNGLGGAGSPSGGVAGSNGGASSELHTAICKGLKDNAGRLTKEAIASGQAPLVIVNDEVIPALDEVGIGFENKKIYLPQLLMSAEAAKAAFEVVKEELAKNPTDNGPAKCNVVIATVKGDIHDIGKNIVKLLLENYGFPVSDLGKDVPPEVIVDEVVKLHAPVCGLSALMTTTVPAMEETIKLLKEKAPWCKSVVGGAVLTQEYADMIHADKYCKDAMGTVRYAEEINSAEE